MAPPDLLVMIALSAAEDDPPPPTTPSNTVLYSVVGVGVLLVGLAVVVVGILVRKRRRITAKIWIPGSPNPESSPPIEAAAGTSDSTGGLATESAL